MTLIQLGYYPQHTSNIQRLSYKKKSLFPSSMKYLGHRTVLISPIYATMTAYLLFFWAIIQQFIRIKSIKIIVLPYFFPLLTVSFHCWITYCQNSLVKIYKTYTKQNSILISTVSRFKTARSIFFSPCTDIISCFQNTIVFFLEPYPRTLTIMSLLVCWK